MLMEMQLLYHPSKHHRRLFSLFARRQSQTVYLTVAISSLNVSRKMRKIAYPNLIPVKTTPMLCRIHYSAIRNQSLSMVTATNQLK
jgi:hypothetical protein